MSYADEKSIFHMSIPYPESTQNGSQMKKQYFVNRYDFIYGYGVQKKSIFHQSISYPTKSPIPYLRHSRILGCSGCCGFDHADDEMAPR